MRVQDSTHTINIGSLYSSQCNVILRNWGTHVCLKRNNIQERAESAGALKVFRDGATCDKGVPLPTQPAMPLCLNKFGEIKQTSDTE
jgi:hypothetical protein